MKEKSYNRRLLYFFECTKCEKIRQTYKLPKAKLSICSKCKTQAVNENQIDLFHTDGGEKHVT